MIRLDEVSFRYRGATEPALSEITCHIRPGELVGLLGRSGSGRSTLASTLNGTIPHLVRGDLQGQVHIGGQDIRAKRPRDLADRVGFVFQDFEAQLFSTNVALEVAFGPENLAVPREEIARRVDRYLRLVRLEALAPQGAGRPLRRAEAAAGPGLGPGPGASGAGAGRADQRPGSGGQVGPVGGGPGPPPRARPHARDH